MGHCRIESLLHFVRTGLEKLSTQGWVLTSRLRAGGCDSHASDVSVAAVVLLLRNTRRCLILANISRMIVGNGGTGRVDDEINELASDVSEELEDDIASLSEVGLGRIGHGDETNGENGVLSLHDDGDWYSK